MNYYLSPIRKLLKLFHPEGIPWPGSLLYNLLSATRIFQHYYDVMAMDIVRYRSEGTLLDVGTGPGKLLMKLHQHSLDLTLTGIDVSSSMVIKARKNLCKAGLSGKIDVKTGNAAALPFPDSSFDLVVSTGSIHHWKDPVACLNDIYRVLKHSGCAIIYDLVSDTPSSILHETAREFGRFLMLMLWLHAFEEPFYTIESFEKIARSSHFNHFQTKFIGVLYCLVLNKTDPG